MSHSHLQYEALEQFLRPIVEDRMRRWPSGPIAITAELCGVSPRTVHRWRKERQLSLVRAEDVADNLGRHPLEVWGPEYASLCLAK